MKILRVASGPVGIVSLLLVGSLTAAFALEPPTREQVERYKRDGTLAARVAQARAFGNHRIAPRLAAGTALKLRRLMLPRPRAGRPMGDIRAQAVDTVMAPPSSWAGMPTTGTVKVLALLIDFSDCAGTTPAATFTSALFGDGTGGFPYESLRNYYRRSSYDQLEIQGDVLGWYTAPYGRDTVAETTSGREAVIKEALTYYDQQGHDFSQYDNDGDGVVDYLCVFWAGPHGEWASFWWGYFTGFSDWSFRLDGKRLSSYSWQWELYNYPSGAFSPTTIIHETGHALGLPDYYDYDDAVGPRGGVGGLDMMAATAGDHNCFSKFMLDWISPLAAAGSRTVELRASGLYRDALVFFPNAADGNIFDEYFMVQNRFRSGNDSGLFTGSDGLLVWHVDARLNSWGTDFLYDNSYTEHKLLKLVEADGLEQIETYGSAAGASDYYRAGMVFGPVTVPDTNRYSGLPTGMGIGDITGTATPMSCTVFSADAPPACDILNIAGGQTLYGTVTVEVSTADDAGVSRVEVYADSLLLGTDSEAPYTFTIDTRPLANGSRRLRAVAYDTIMQTTEDSVPVFVDNIFAPQNLKAERVVDRGAILQEYIDVLRWSDNVKNISVTKFRVYVLENGERRLLAAPTADSGPAFRYLHRAVEVGKTSVYEVVGVGSQEREGDPATASVR